MLLFCDSEAEIRIDNIKGKWSLDSLVATYK